MATPRESNIRSKEIALHARCHLLAEDGFRLHGRAWKVPVKQIPDTGCNLDIRNPAAKQDFDRVPFEQLADDISQKEFRIAEIMREIKGMLGGKP